MNDINLTEIQYKLYDSLKESKWNNVLKLFILSDDFLDILKYLFNESSHKRHFGPTLKYLFRAFQECSYDDLKVVIIGQDPYNTYNDADGLAFSTSLAKTALADDMQEEHRLNITLDYMFNEIERTVYPEKEYVRDKDLKRWANQGILLLNTPLTARLFETDNENHTILWAPFVEYLMNTLNEKKENLIYVFIGKKSQKLIYEVNESKNKIYKLTHPLTGVYMRHGWNCEDIFNKINKDLKNKIKW